MTDTFRQEVETQESMDKLQREVLTVVRDCAKENILDPELMVTFSADFQSKVDIYGTVHLYGSNHERVVYGQPWFSIVSQEEPFRIWKRV